MNITVACAWCGEMTEKPVKEVNRARRLGRRSFCSLSCSVRAGNEARKPKEVVKKCPHCGKRFKSSTSKKAATFCSRSCASAGSMSESRREAQRQAGLKAVVAGRSNLISIPDTLKLREAWKYAALKEVLDGEGRSYEFEYPIGRWIFDLALLDEKALVEFDGPHHRTERQTSLDNQKDEAGQAAGFVVIRRRVEPASIIHPNTIEGL